MSKQPLFSALGDKAPGQLQEDATHPLPEDKWGGGDICSVEDMPPTDDDKPLD